MDFMQNIFSSAFNPRQNLIQVSQRGGLPEFIEILPAYPSYFAENPNLDSGNKVILPTSVLHDVINRYDNDLPNPLIFSLSTLEKVNTVYVGVLEFGDLDNMCVLPLWLFKVMKLREGEMLRVGLVPRMEKATFVKLRPHKMEFVELPDPRSLLEIHLRNFVCLTLNQTICINFMEKEYYLDVLELRPKNQYNAAVIVDTDLHLEFAPPLDYVEPSIPAKVLPCADAQVQSKPSPFEGTATRLDGNKISAPLNDEANKFDPRKHRIIKGIRKEEGESFEGQATYIGDR